MIKRTSPRRASLSLAALLGMGVSAFSADAQTAPFDAVHFERARSLQLAGNPDEVFHLFEPDGRSLWARGFQPEFLHKTSGDSWAGTVFRTAPHGGDDYTTWLVADHKSESRRMRYVIFIPAVEAWEFEVECVANPDGGTVATIVYRITSLSEEANDAVSRFFSDRFDPAMDSWEAAINAYLTEKEG